MINMDYISQVIRDIIQVVSRLSNALRANTEVSCTLCRGQLPTASTNPVYTVRDLTRVILKEIVVTNTTAGALTYTLSIMDPSTAEAASGAAGGRYYVDVPIAAKETHKYDHNIFLNPQERIYMWASGTGVNARISGMEITAL